MCGIIGIATGHQNQIAAMIKKSLVLLTYRGYDSCGVAIRVGNSLRIRKNAGRAENLQSPSDTRGAVGIGHTRWATHGAVSKRNAHPHCDCSRSIAVVHNGIIDNYALLRQQLERRGHKFQSETDTEVIPHLIEERLKYYQARKEEAPFLKAFRDTVKKLRGTYAIAALWSKEDRIYAVRKTSPLIVGVGKRSHFITSDLSAFLEYTNAGIPLEDDQIAVISPEEFKVYNLALEPVATNTNVYPLAVQEISKGDNAHFMVKEIKEQDTVLKELWEKQDEIEEVANQLAPFLKGVKRVYLTGCGSSFHACLAGEYIFERLLHIPSKAVLSSEWKRTVGEINDIARSLVIAVSQSGETLDTYVVLEELSRLKRKPLVLSLVNVPFSSQERLAQSKLPRSRSKLLRLHAKLEICVVATKTYTAEIFLLALLALKLGKQILPPDTQKEIDKLLQDAESIPGKVRAILSNRSDKAGELADRYISPPASRAKHRRGLRESIFLIGRGINLVTAYEAALKIREVCYVSALGIAGGELKHGSLAAVDSTTPVIALFPPASDTGTWKSIMNNFMEVQARGTPIVSLCGEGEATQELRRLSRDVVTLPQTNWIFYPILQVVFLQLFSYYGALARGVDPDYPQHLAKTVTVE